MVWTQQRNEASIRLLFLPSLSLDRKPMYCACPLEWDGRSSKFYVSQRVLGSMAGLAAKHLGYHMGFSARWEGFFLKVVLSDRWFLEFRHLSRATFDIHPSTYCTLSLSLRAPDPYPVQPEVYQIACVACFGPWGRCNTLGVVVPLYGMYEMMNTTTYSRLVELCWKHAAPLGKSLYHSRNRQLG